MPRVISTHLGSLVQAARERMGLSQEVLADRLGLARPISVSKWERGAAPVPVHHWQPLLRILKLTRRQILDAAQADNHRQLLVFTSLNGSFAQTPGEFADLGWSLVLRGLAPNVAAQVEQIRRENMHLTPSMLVNMAVSQFVASLPPAGAISVDKRGRSTVHHLAQGGTPLGAAGFRVAQTG